WGATRVAKFWEKQAQKKLPKPEKKRARPQEILDGLRQAVPDDVLLTTDVGSHKILASLDWPTLAPNKFMLSNGLSCMGYGVPAAIASSLALSHGPTVALTGDGGFGMILGELNLIHELNTPVIIVIMNDEALDLIRSAQTRSERETFGTEFTNPDFKKIAQAYDLTFAKVRSAEECREAVSKAIAENRPLIVEALIDPKSYPTTP
ncbi:MAG: thiamine pyrophosphate-dependent enzyme, partial [Chloroflexota bacterium]